MTRKRTSNEAFTKDQVRRLLENITIPRDKIMIEVGIYSGTRVNELRTLRYDKVDFVHNTITVWDDKKNQWSWKLDKNTGRKVRDQKLSEGKWRKIKMPAWVMLNLKVYISKYPTQTDYVWQIGWITFERVIQKWTSKILHTKRSWHTLRHTYVSLHSAIKTPISVMKVQTGDTAATLLKVYDNPSPDMIEEAAESKLI
jgi:integrase